MQPRRLPTLKAPLDFTPVRDRISKGKVIVSRIQVDFSWRDEHASAFVIEFAFPEKSRDENLHQLPLR